VGSGFTAAGLEQLLTVLTPLSRPISPFTDSVPDAGLVHWVEPRIVGEVAFREWTADGRLRHPVWRGLRADKAAAEVVRESRPTLPR
jgi:bifunctional non-homologous end joining protein LigD